MEKPTQRKGFFGGPLIRTCSKDELAEAILLGIWEVQEDAGVEFTFSRYNGKIYLLDYKAAPL